VGTGREEWCSQVKYRHFEHVEEKTAILKSNDVQFPGRSGMMTLHQLVSKLMNDMRIEDLMPHIERLIAYDRFQASGGIQEAAAYVADVALRVGLKDISVKQFPADGKARWWSYKTAVSWTPTQARLAVSSLDGLHLEVDHATHPMSLATYSSPTATGGLVARLVNIRAGTSFPDLKHAIAVVSDPGGDWVEKVTSAGAMGFVTAISQNDSVSGRIELRPNSSIFGFSLSAHDLRIVRRCAEQGANARVIVDIDRTASMPVFTGVLPGTSRDEEIWITAHLCHPRPGANDNASGVAAALGIAAALRRNRLPRRRSIRFICGPEFLGVAAMLHSAISKGRSMPAAVINLDMVGEDQAICGGPFIVEQSPDCITSTINALAEAVVEEVFAVSGDARSRWKPAPFTGFSDHALFAGPEFARPAVQFCHHSDRFNHSSVDSLDKVSANEMIRSAVSGAALAQLLSNPKALALGQIIDLVAKWCKRGAIAAEQIAKRHRKQGERRWAQDFIEYVNERYSSSDSYDSHKVRKQPGSVLKRRWEGPFNARAMIDDMPEAPGSGVRDLISQNKQVLSLLLNFAIRINGHRSRREILNGTSFSFGHPISEDNAHYLFDAMIQSRWVSEESDSGLCRT
jgi:Domain of unknown function (DUF4910)